AIGLLGCALAQIAEACPSVPAPVRDINAVDYHADADGKVLDPTLRGRNDAAMVPMRTFVRIVSGGADHFVAENTVSAGMCAIADLRQWAEAGALLGTMANVQAERERAGLLSGLALSYLKTKELARPSDRAAIEPWLDKLADAVQANFGNPAGS